MGDNFTANARDAGSYSGQGVQFVIKRAFFWTKGHEQIIYKETRDLKQVYSPKKMLNDLKISENTIHRVTVCGYTTILH